MVGVGVGVGEDSVQSGTRLPQVGDGQCLGLASASGGAGAGEFAFVGVQGGAGGADDLAGDRHSLFGEPAPWRAG